MRRFLFLLIVFFVGWQGVKAQFGNYKLIAHRGGVVNDTLQENSIQSIQEAGRQGYWMVELDIRMTSDSVLVAHHDANLNRYFGVNQKVEELSWGELQQYRSALGNRIQKLETMLDVCVESGLQVMIDLKVRGLHLAVFEQLVQMLRVRNLQDRALIIPSGEATDFFRGKIRLSCTREQIENYQKRGDYDATHYYLFANPSQEDFQWAKENDIQVVGIINNFRKKEPTEYQQTADHLKQIGVKYVQLDSEFSVYFKNSTSLALPPSGTLTGR